MIWLFAVLFFIVWTLFIAHAMYATGQSQGKKDALEEQKSSVYNQYLAAPEISEETLNEIASKAADLVDIPPTSCTFTPTAQGHLVTLWDEHVNKGSLVGRLENLEDRMPRVERKAGMSV